VPNEEPGDDGRGALERQAEPVAGAELADGGFQLPDLQGLLAQAQQMQEQLLAAQVQAASQVFTGQAGGGVVHVELTGDLDVQAVRISPEVVDPDDIGMLEDLVLAAFRDAVSQVQQGQQASLGDLGLGGLSGGLGGLLGD
jgi:hypothetical protein